MDRLTALRGVEILQGLSDEEMRRLATAIKKESFTAGEVILRAGRRGGLPSAATFPKNRRARDSYLLGQAESCTSRMPHTAASHDVQRVPLVALPQDDFAGRERFLLDGGGEPPHLLVAQTLQNLDPHVAR